MNLTKPSAAFAFAVVAAITTGCASIPVRLFNAQHKDCKEKPTQATVGDGWVEEVAACGQRELYMRTHLASRRDFYIASFMGAMKAFAFEGDCAEEEIDFQVLDNRTVAFRGCGRKAIFKKVYGAGWVQNSSRSSASRGVMSAT